MRTSSQLFAATCALSLICSGLSSGARAETVFENGDWYIAAHASDATETVYVSKNISVMPDDSGRKMAEFLLVVDGPEVSNQGGMFAQYTVVEFDCDEGTMATVSYTNFDRAGNIITRQDYDVSYSSFQPVGTDPKVDAAHALVCGTRDPGSFRTTGEVSLVQIIEANIAAYDKVTGGTFVY